MKHAALAALAFLVSASALSAEKAHEEPSRANPDEALRSLLEGNQRYVEGRMAACQRTDAAARGKLATSQKPAAIVLSCSDSRVPPELVFDQSLGELFVVRVAGNVSEPGVLGSVEYAAEHLGSSLVVVLGHERCGAVTAAAQSHGRPAGNVGSLLQAIAPSVARARKQAGTDEAALVDAAITLNVENTVAQLTRQSPVLARLARSGALKIVGARYDLDDGKVTVLEPAAPARPGKK